MVYVISAPGYPYEMLTDTQMSTWDSVNVNGVETIYYIGNCSLIKPRMVKFPVDESYKTMGYKNLLAFEWAIQNRQWDYMARVNSSCYVRKHKLIDYAQTLPDKGLFRGIGVVGQSGEVEWLWGGMQYIISRDVVELILQHQIMWAHAFMEDVAMSKLVKYTGIPLDTSGRGCSIDPKDGHWVCCAYEDNRIVSFEFLDFSEMKKAENQHFIRVKQNADRRTDVEIMKSLHSNGI